MKKFLFLFSIIGLFLLSTKSVGAVELDHCCKVDCDKLSKVSHIVACYESGLHGIVGQSEEHQGADYVKLFPNGFLFQFFCGTSASEGLHREISLWKLADNKCPKGWILLEDPHPEWGDYLVPGANYCVKTITLPCRTNNCS